MCVSLGGDRINVKNIFVLSSEWILIHKRYVLGGTRHNKPEKLKQFSMTFSFRWFELIENNTYQIFFEE